MITAEQHISDLILCNPSLEVVLDRFQIGKAEHGLSVATACEERALDVAFFVEILNVFSKTHSFPQKRLRHFSIPIILDYLQRTHAYYLDKRLLEIEQSIFNLKRKIGKSQAIILLLDRFFEKYAEELVEHIETEENHLFPYIQFLLQAQKQQPSYQEVLKQSNRYSVRQFMEDHDDEVEGQLIDVRNAIVHYRAKMRKPISFKVLLTQLELFEEDLQVHALVEDQSLMPKAVRLEDKVLQLYNLN